MKAGCPISTLHACMGHAAYEGFSEYKYTDRDWVKYEKWRKNVFDKLSREEQKKMYDEERRTNTFMGPSDCLVEKSRKHTDYDMSVFAMFIQTWGSTALGFGGIGGAAMTSAYVTIIESDLTGEYAVYFGGRLAYVIKRPNAKFIEDVNNRRMVDASKGKALYEDKMGCGSI